MKMHADPIVLVRARHVPMEPGRLNAMGWKATTDMRAGLAVAYRDFLAAYK